LLLQRSLDLRAGQVQRYQLVAERLACEQVSISHRAVLLPGDIGADAAGISHGNHGAAVLLAAGGGELRIRNDIA